MLNQKISSMIVWYAAIQAGFTSRLAIMRRYFMVTEK
jgi:hypothetical protein